MHKHREDVDHIPTNMKESLFILSDTEAGPDE